MKTHNEGAQNYYQLLGIDRKATADEIRSAYLVKIKQWHPDKTTEASAEAEAMTKLLNAAYATLKDPEQRKQYDRMLRFTGRGDFGSSVSEEAFQRKFEKAAPVFAHFSAKVFEMFGLFRDSVQKRYRLHPVTLGTLGAGLFYFILPTDMIPDFLPFLGFVDDMAVLAMIAKSLQSELESYRKWKSDRTSGLHETGQ